MNSNNQVKQLRLQRAVPEQLAEMAGLSVRTIQRIENGERRGWRPSAPSPRSLR